MGDGAGNRPFWETKTLDQMNDREWESLCDGCGNCCLTKLEDWDTGNIGVTDVACYMLDLHSCKCRDYKNRKDYVPDCIQLRPKDIPTYDWLPETCAYRLLSQGQRLAWWHPLISGNPDTVHRAGISVRGQAISEHDTKQPGTRIRHWIKRKPYRPIGS